MAGENYYTRAGSKSNCRSLHGAGDGTASVTAGRRGARLARQRRDDAGRPGDVQPGRALERPNDRPINNARGSRPHRGCGKKMNDVTRILHSIESGDPKAADQLLPLVYEE